MKVNEYKKDEVIFRQGDYATSFYRILGGNVGVFVCYGTENEKQLTTLHESDYLGEMGVIEAYPRSATAVALEDGTKLEEIDEKEFSDYFTNRTGELLQIMRQMAQRLRDRTDDYEEACRTLDDLQKTFGEPEKRSKSLLDKIKEMIINYNNAIFPNI
jgi:CRP-like cAMP-binding protein